MISELEAMFGNEDFLSSSDETQAEAVNLLVSGYANTAQEALDMANRIDAGVLLNMPILTKLLTPEQIQLLNDLSGCHTYSEDAVSAITENRQALEGPNE